MCRSHCPRLYRSQARAPDVLASHRGAPRYKQAVGGPEPLPEPEIRSWQHSVPRLVSPSAPRSWTERGRCQGIHERARRHLHSADRGFGGAGSSYRPSGRINLFTSGPTAMVGPVQGNFADASRPRSARMHNGASRPTVSTPAMLGFRSPGISKQGIAVVVGLGIGDPLACAQAKRPG